MRRLLQLATLAVLMVLAACAVAITFYISDADCHARGGHTEVVYGGRGAGWTCSGARP